MRSPVRQPTAAGKLTSLRSPHALWRSYIVICLASLIAVLACSAASAGAETTSPWWHLTSTATPSYLSPGGEGEIYVNANNLGDAVVDGEISPVQITDTLPAGLQAISVVGEPTAGSGGEDGPVNCPTAKQIEEGAVLTCTFAGAHQRSNGEGGVETVPVELPPYDDILLIIRVKVAKGAATCAQSVSTCEQNHVSVAGGGAPSASLSAPVAVSKEAVPFGLQVNELGLEAAGGGADTQAGSHPFQVTSTLVFNQVLQAGGEGILPAPVALPKNIGVKLPPGLVGNPTPLPRCTLGQFLHEVSGSGNQCSQQTAVGVASLLVNEPGNLGRARFLVPVFNIEPAFGEPARFGFFIPISGTPVLLETTVRGGPGTGEEYAVTVGPSNIVQTAGLLSSEVTFWGVPGDPAHNDARGWGCLAATRHAPASELAQLGQSCEPEASPHPPGFLVLPTSCTRAPLQSATELNSWADPKEHLTVPTTQPLPTLDGCNQLAFGPTIAAEPTTDAAASASGLDFNLGFHDEGLTSAEGVAESQLRDTTVTLPPGFTINPSAGVGLAGCSEADFARETLSSAPGAGCPNESKLGTVEIETPLLTQKIDGNIFIAQPYENPFGSLVALYIVAKNPETGIMIKLPGKVTPNPVTGQLVTTFENTPQLPFDRFNFHFREGQQAPLITPPTCGTYTTGALLTPWSEPLAPLTETSSFQITSGAGGGACPAGNVAPFNPGIEAGTVNNNAGAFSSFDLHLSRGDADQEISGFSTNLPPGLSGYLTGLPFCGEAEIEAARNETGVQAEQHPICPASEVGHSLVGTGVGATLAYVPGKLYWAGPFQGAPFSLVSVTSAKVGPFDLGTVVLRFGLNINPYNTQISVSPSSSEPIPAIINGIVTHVRDIRVYVDRPHFIINPSSCEPMAIGSTLTADEGGSATVSSPFQAASCANLKFAPKLSASTQGKTSRAAGASLTVKVVEPDEPQGTQSWISTVKVELPKQLPSRLTTLQKACTAKQFEVNPAACPSASMIGHAKVTTPILPVPLEGPAIFVSHGGEAFPSLEFVLQGYGVKIILVGSTYISKSGITSSTFNKTIDDQPFSTFELTLPEGPYSALAANGNLCALTTTKTVTKKVTVKVKTRGRVHKKTVTRKVKQTVAATLTMPTELIAFNGAEIHQNTKVSVTGCPKAAKVKRPAKKHKRSSKRKK
jgi:hypothetical protein